MNAFTNVQIINGPNGEPVYVVIPYTTYMQTQSRHKDTDVPHQVVGMIAENAWTPARAWREYLGLTQLEVATRMGITQPAYAQQEVGLRPRRSTRERIAMALGIAPRMLDF
ncbi:helix-turn-helix transcriptional regulator [Pseudoduganella sp. SL102]|uniref:Transcriptional regulator n=1 Tax=Pseudoduganella albidiflava TaxID=321983 RepID=A0A411WXC8_9BURK|nr:MULTISPECIES: helix-turn-helix transcriptional regulator [Pseudoduganella]QBI01187.1 XRE family transcriptional regulator [Pseudoduganella albidiflava]WBS00703.1 helix-turn-helix transcriptional regulator [Pseudoduganella sp. SL102]GGY48785.1 transcriptional regulator [Pseudoduganella albidiflava]